MHTFSAEFGLQSQGKHSNQDPPQLPLNIKKNNFKPFKIVVGIRFKLTKYMHIYVCEHKQHLLTHTLALQISSSALKTTVCEHTTPHPTIPNSMHKLVC